MDWVKIKIEVLKQAEAQVRDKLQALAQEIKQLDESAASDSKSSMGDKYETGREMIQQERAKISEQIQQNEKHLLNITQAQTKDQMVKIAAGALVVTSKANYLIATSLGMIKKPVPVFLLSPLAPIAQQMLDLSAGDSFEFNGAKITIDRVL